MGKGCVRISGLLACIWPGSVVVPSGSVVVPIGPLNEVVPDSVGGRPRAVAYGGATETGTALWPTRAGWPKRVDILWNACKHNLEP